MAGVYRPRHPERTVLYRVLFHYFERFLAKYERRFEREYGFFRPIIKEVVERYLDCGNPRCGGPMKVIAFITDFQAVDRIIEHLKLVFVAEKPPPSHIFVEVALMAAEESVDYF
jgi:hypothetical protein